MTKNNPSSLRFAFILFTTIIVGFLGLFLSTLFIPKSAGLAGGAMVLLSGMGGLLVGLIAAIILSRKLKPQTLKTATQIATIIGIGLVGWGLYGLITTRQAIQEDIEKTKEFHKTHKPTATVDHTPTPSVFGKNEAIGTGLIKPSIKLNTPLYLYSAPNDVTPSDSITYKALLHGDLDIDHAPKEFKPVHLKLDYQIFYLRAKQESDGFFEVVIDEKSGKTTFVKSEDITFMPWKTFLLNVFAVEIHDPENNPIRKQPLRHATPLPNVNKNATLQPIEIKGEWLRVKVLNDDMETSDIGWFRWRSEDALLVTYSLLN